MKEITLPEFDRNKKIMEKEYLYLLVNATTMLLWVVIFLSQV